MIAVLPSRHRMRRSVEYATAMRRSRRAGRRTLVVHVSREPAVEDRTTRVGFVVSKAVGGAVVRNRVRRRLRHLVRDRLGPGPDGTLVVIRALPPAASASTAELVEDLESALRQVTGGDRIPAGVEGGR